MKTFRWLLYLACTCALFAACHDDDEPIYPPEDNNVLFAGENKVITLQEQTKNFRSPEYRCKIKAGDGREFTRIGDHVRLEGLSILTFQTGLKPGIYRLLALEYPELTAGSSVVPVLKSDT